MRINYAFQLINRKPTKKLINKIPHLVMWCKDNRFMCHDCGLQGAVRMIWMSEQTAGESLWSIKLKTIHSIDKICCRWQ